jgi:lysophospholipase L1-like esterase
MTQMENVQKILESTGKFWIAFVGDSITSTEWVHPNWREIVEYVLKEELQPKFNDWKIASWGIRGINHGYDGSTTKDILGKMEIILHNEPDLIIGLMGGNDRLFGIKPEETAVYIKQIINKARQVGVGVTWCTSIPAHTRVDKNKEYEPYAKATMAIPVEPDVKMIDMFEQFKEYDLDRFFTFKSENNPEEGVKEGGLDFWHPNQLGNAYIAKIILREVFGVEFDPEKYIKGTLGGEKYPRYK